MLFSTYTGIRIQQGHLIKLDYTNLLKDNRRRKKINVWVHIVMQKFSDQQTSNRWYNHACNQDQVHLNYWFKIPMHMKHRVIQKCANCNQFYISDALSLIWGFVLQISMPLSFDFMQLMIHARLILIDTSQYGTGI